MAYGAAGDEAILEDCRKYLRELTDADEGERKQMQDDLAFCTLDQWPADIRKERENDVENGARPCLTIDKINQYIVQVVNDLRQGKPGINVRPQDDEADVETAKVLKGIIRNIEDQSSADIAYASAAENAVKMGLGYFRINTRYVADDSFDQEIIVQPIPNTFSVHLGPHIMPDGSDAERGYISESMPEDKFKAMFPKAKFSEDDFDGLGENAVYWREGKNIVVVEEFVIEKAIETLYFLSDGTTITESEYTKWPDAAGPKPSISDRRDSVKKQLKWRKMTGIEVLEERDLPGEYIPIVEMIGRESWVKGKRILWGLVRPAKDSLRMYNYWASTVTEKMALAPKAPFIGAVGQFNTMSERWKKANKVNYSYLEYDNVDTVSGNALPAPQRQGPAPMEAAMMHQMQIIEHDVQTSLGMFKAAVGETESQQSGRAILALQRESDTGTYHFGANQGTSIRHAGRIILGWIPAYYDTKRIVRILGEDGAPQIAHLDPAQDMARREIKGLDGGIEKVIHNPNIGKYDVSITVGPSYNTKRMEAAATLTEVVKSQPQLMPLVGDLLFRSLDFPYSDQIAERLRKMLPPPLQEGQGDPAAQMGQMMQKMQMMGQQMQEIQKENMQLKAGTAEGMAKVQADAQAKQAALQAQQQIDAAELALQKAKQEGELQLARDKAAAEIEIKRMVAECDHHVEVGKLNLQVEQKKREMMMQTQSEDAIKAESLAPNLIQAMQAIVQEFAQMVAQQQAGMQSIVSAMEKSNHRTITLGDIRHNRDGSISGASATVN